MIIIIINGTSAKGYDIEATTVIQHNLERPIKTLKEHSGDIISNTKKAIHTDWFEELSETIHFPEEPLTGDYVSDIYDIRAYEIKQEINIYE